MAKYRNNLPLTGDRIFLTDSGLETWLIFLKGFELPQGAAFHLMKDTKGRATILEYYEQHIALAKARGLGFILETPTWRANRDWGAKIGYSEGELTAANRDAVAAMAALRDRFETPESPMVISGNIGPRGDGYQPSAIMNAKEACQYHAAQVHTFSQTEADMVSAFTMNYIDEPVGIAHACELAGMPCVLSLTVETDGRLPGGETMKQAVEEIDRRTGSYPLYYMINCAHPTHFDEALAAGEDWVKRIRGVRANSSKKSHAELDESPTLDEGNPAELGKQYRAIRNRLPHVTVLGGCCGTDFRHVEQICLACTEVGAEAA